MFHKLNQFNVLDFVNRTAVPALQKLIFYYYWVVDSIKTSLESNCDGRKYLL